MLFYNYCKADKTFKKNNCLKEEIINVAKIFWQERHWIFQLPIAFFKRNSVNDLAENVKC